MKTPRKRKPRGQLNDEQIERLMRDYQAGHPIAELEQRYGIHRKTITSLRARLGIPDRPRKGQRVATDEAIEQARARLNVHRIEEVG